MEITLSARDGYRLGATLYGGSERAVLVMPATGVPRCSGAPGCGRRRTLVGALGRLYPNSRWETRTVAPRELGVKALGHFGFFRERFRDSLWRETADWLEQR